jgi:hypothetical protein
MTTTPSVLTIDVQDLVAYQADISDPSQFATHPDITIPNTPRNFFVVTLIGDIVSVNGDPAKGTYVGRTRVVKASLNPSAGGAIADVERTAMREHIFEILKANRTEIGTIMSTGFSGGDAPPGTGAPSDEGGNWAIVGGTGAYLGARGEVVSRPPTGGGLRQASMSEDPGRRRFNHGLRNTFILHIIPMDPPQIMTTSAGPLIIHSSFIPVTALRPAVANQHLSLFASGLGPTHPDIDLAQPFPLNPPSLVNSPLTVSVNGITAQILSAVGVPGAVNAYQVNFKMPAIAGTGLVPIRLSAGWLAGPPVSIWVA